MLRQWREDDIAPFVNMNQDPQVMEYFPEVYSAQKTRSSVARVSDTIDKNGWGFWAAERRDSGEFIGFIGINPLEKGFPFAPCVEIGWRLAVEHWQHGFATEGALAAMAYGFEQAKLDEIVAMTAVANFRSEKVMQKLGMHNAQQNFMHPNVTTGHPLSEHVLYRLTRAQWLAKQKGMS